jgi:hypothetical protein
MAMTRAEKRKKQAERAVLIRFRRRLELERDNWGSSDWRRLSSSRHAITGTAYADLERTIEDVDYQLEKLDLELEPTPKMPRRKRRTLRRTAHNEKTTAPPVSEPSHPLNADPDIAKRRAIIKQNPESDLPRLCTMFDQANVPTPKGWIQDEWAAACRNAKYRQLIHQIVSKDRRKNR